MKQPAIYIITNKPNGTLYTGVTSNLLQRIYQHKEKIVNGFSSKYYCHRLVYYEFFSTMPEAIAREKQLKAGSRKKKLILIAQTNALWKDLSYDLI